jgi:cytochrome b561
MTPLRVSIFAAAAALILLAVVFELMRSRRLQERYALLWLLTGIVVFVLAVWRSLLGWAADAVGIAYPPSALAQRLALLENRLEERETRAD